MKKRILLELMIANYSSDRNLGWVPMEEILIKTGMSSFNQRFQEMRALGINIINRTINMKSKYKLKTHPNDIDQERFSCKTIQPGLGL